MILLVVAVGALGLVTGSFLNVVVHRVPRHESIVRPGSRCPSCQVQISAWDNIPVLSWLWLRGQCRHCAGAISARYPAIELVTGALFVLLAIRFRLPVELAAFAVFFAALVAITAIDIELRLVPKRIVWPVFGLGVVLLATASIVHDDVSGLLDAAIGAVAAFVVLFAIHLISPRGMGFGDVRLAALLGLYLGWISPPHVGLGLFAGFVAGGVSGIAALALGRPRKSALPFAPFLSLGAVIAVIWGEPILEWYARLG